MPFTFEKTDIPDVIIINPRVFKDERGYFAETYKSSEFTNAGIPQTFVQDNQSCSSKGVIRGLHYQKNPAAQGKLVRVVYGSIFDVAVDLRKDSQTYGKWIGVELSAANKKMLYIPVGFAHGFAATSEKAEITYKMTNEYSTESEAGIIWNDPDIDINWPVNDPLISANDKHNPRFSEIEDVFYTVD